MAENRPLQREPGADWLVGGGEMGKLIRAKDWAETPLGPIEDWPQSLRTTVSILLASNFPINIIWGPGRVQIYNDGYWPICGAKHPRSMGQDYKECWASAWDAVGPPFEKASQGRTDFLVNERMFLDRDGYLEETFFTYSLSPIRDESGGVGGLFHPVTELTQQTLGERRLTVVRAVADRAADVQTVAGACAAGADALAEHALDVPFALLYLIDPDGLRATLAAATGLGVDDVARPAGIDLTAIATDGWPLAAAVHDRRVVEVDDLARRFGSSSSGPYPEPPRVAMLLPITVSGVAQPVAALIAGVSARRALDDPYRTFYLMLRDTVTNAVTNARAYEGERRRAEALAALDEAKTVFFSNISHEFRTPLTLMTEPVAGLRAALAGTAELDREQLRGELELVHRSGLRLGKLVNSLLDFSRIQAGRVQVAYEPVDIAVVTRELAGVFRSAMERAGLVYTVDCADVGEPVYVDRDLWEKVVLNLLSNAFKYTLAGSVTVTVRRSGGTAELRVSDTGVGVPVDELPRLFERFHRASNVRSRSMEGTGIGLALTKELVELHGGSISADSVVDEGTTITVTLPLGRGHLTEDQIKPTTSPVEPLGAEPFLAEAWGWLRSPATGTGQPAGEPGPGRTQGRVLIVDDNADMREYLDRLLSPYYTVRLAGDGAAALAWARADPPDLVLTDVMMPGLDGIEFVAALRADPATASLPIVVLSARAGQEAAVDGLAAGADDYLVKPFSAEELLARVRTHLDLSRSRVGESHRMRVLADGVLSINRATGVRNALDRLSVAAREVVGTHAAMSCLVTDDDWDRAMVSVSRSDKYAAGEEPEFAACERNLCERVRVGAEVVRLPGPAAHGVLVAGLTNSVDEGVGLIQLADRRTGTFTADDEAVLVQLAAVASAVLERFQMLRQQTEIAVTLQQSILGPLELPDPFAVRYDPAGQTLQVGGDWYDVVAREDGGYGVIVGDVVGGGLHAAAVMGQLRSAARAELAEGRSPAEVLTALDRFAALLPEARCCTVFCAVIDPAAGTVRYSSAGHPPALLADPHNGHHLLEQAQLYPLDAVPDAVRPEAEAPVPPGATLVLYTDGLVERRGRSIDRGIEAVAAILDASPDLPPAALANLIAERLIAADHEDDVAFLLYRQPAAEGGRRPLRLLLTARFTELHRLRGSVRAWLAAVGVDHATAGELVHVVGEVATNAIEHGSAQDPRRSVQVFGDQLADGVRFVVRDTGRWIEPPADPSRTFGLAIARAFTDALAIDTTSTGTAVRLTRRTGAR